MIVADASVLIAHLDAGDAHHERATALLLARAGEPLGASTLTLADVLVGPARAGRLGDARSALDQLGVEELPLGADAPARLAELRTSTGLKLPDCCVLLAAEEAGAEAVASFDDGLRSGASRRGLGLA